MSRYVNVLMTGRPSEQAQSIINEYLQGEGFKYINERGELVWRKGVGALASPQFMKAEPADDGTVRIESWIAGAALVPGVYGGELNPMEGVWGWGPKMALKPRIQELERRLGGTSVPQAEVAESPAGWHPDPTGRHESRYWDGTRWTANVSDAGQASTDPEGVA